MNCSRKELRDVLQWMAEETLADVPGENEIQYTFSPRFEEWGREMLASGGKRRIRVSRAVKILLIAALLAALLAVSAVALPAIRGEAREYLLVERQDNLLSVEFPEASVSEKQVIETYYAPTWWPEGWECQNSDANPHGQRIEYEDRGFGPLFFSQHTLNISVCVGVSGEMEIYRLNVDELQVDVVPRERGRTMMWIKDGYLFSLHLTNTVSDEDAVRMIRSMEAYEPSAECMEAGG